MARPKDSKKQSGKKNKIHLVFDEKERKEFLTGFHKRKLQRKKEAKEKFLNTLKEERKRIKAEAKESYKKLLVSHRPIPELEDFLSEKYEDEKVTVKVVELSKNEIAKQNNWLGENQTTYENEDAQEESEEEEDSSNELPGMELKPKRIEKPKVEKEVVNFSSGKEIKRALKKQATKTVKKSKVFNKMNEMERRKQRKKSMQLKKQKMKIIDKKKGKRGLKKRSKE
ncbi:unnamed protein product [Phyllotreta striolata]|uniref:Nucleolar protein 12 n=1 Tax=Phyllotreta striolata TaxID=444603 RepID=A0A9N9TRM2_PHYSR|nr:unnamed protein product [Phyllotreta striolata]